MRRQIQCKYRTIMWEGCVLCVNMCTHIHMRTHLCYYHPRSPVSGGLSVHQLFVLSVCMFLSPGLSSYSTSVSAFLRWNWVWTERPHTHTHTRTQSVCVRERDTYIGVKLFNINLLILCPHAMSAFMLITHAELKSCVCDRDTDRGWDSCWGWLVHWEESLSSQATPQLFFCTENYCLEHCCFHYSDVMVCPSPERYCCCCGRTW